jgi:MFS family permease
VGDLLNRSAGARTVPIPGSRALTLAVFVDAAGAGFFTSLSLLFLISYNGMSAAAAGIGVTIGSLAAFACVPLAGLLTQRLGARTSLQISNIATAAGALLYLPSHSWIGAAIASFVVMSADRIYGAAWPVLVSRVAGREKVAAWLASTNAVRTGAVGLGALAATLVLSTSGDIGLLIALLVNSASKLISFFFLRLVPIRHLQSRTSERPSRLRDVFHNKPFMRLLWSQTLLSFAWTLPPIVLPVLLVESLGLPAYWASIALVCRYVTVTALQIPARRLVDSWSTARISLVAVAIASLAIVVAAATTFPGAAAVAGIAAAVSSVLVALAEIISKPSASAVAVALAPPDDEGPHMAVFQLSWTLAYAIGPLLVGVGIAQPGWMWATILVALAASALIQLGQLRPRTSLKR